MSFSHNDHQLINTECFGSKIIGKGMRKRDAKLKTPICDGLFDLPRVINLKIQCHLGILHAKLSQSLWQDILGGDNNACDVETSNDHFPQLGSLAFGCRDSLKQVLGVAIEKNSGFSQVHPPSDAAKKRDPKFGLQLMDLVRHIRLAHMELFSSPGKAREPSDRFEYSESSEGQQRWRIGTLGGWVVLHTRLPGLDCATGDQKFTSGPERLKCGSLMSR